MDDLDPAELRHLHDMLSRNHNGDQALLELPGEEVLSSLRMTTTVDGKVTPTVAGILLAGRQEVLGRAMPTTATSAS